MLVYVACRHIQLQAEAAVLQEEEIGGSDTE